MSNSSWMNVLFDRLDLKSSLSHVKEQTHSLLFSTVRHIVLALSRMRILRMSVLMSTVNLKNFQINLLSLVTRI